MSAGPTPPARAPGTTANIRTSGDGGATIGVRRCRERQDAAGKTDEVTFHPREQPLA